jgi:uncharacterized membrane protein YgcG
VSAAVLRWLQPLAIVLALSGVAGAADSERILDYHSDVIVNPDGSLEVTETIAVQAAGDQIKRGIYRDFPTVYPGAYWTRVVVPFHVLEVRRDGDAEPYHIEEQPDGVRVYLGRSDVLLRPGRYTYTIVYRTDRQLGFFDTHDELYWNVTGNGWKFPIGRASASVMLPAAVPRDQVKLEGYTGPQGSTAHHLRTSVDPTTGALLFTTTRPLAAYEGLTIVASFPKAYVRAPTDEERWEAFKSGNRIMVVGTAGIGLVLAYYAIAWLLVGRDPRRGTIIPLFEPPLRMPPACVRYVVEMGYDQRCFTAALISMAVKGWLRVEDDDGTYTLVRTAGNDSPLSLGERRLAAQLLSSGRVVLEQSNHQRIKKSISALREALQLEYEGKVFLANRRWMIPGMALSVLGVLAMAVSGTGAQLGGFAFMGVWLSVWTFAVFTLLTRAGQAWWEVLRPRGSTLARVGAVVAALVVTAFAVPFLGGEVAGLYMLAQMTTVWVVPILLTLIGLNFLFFHLLKRPTRAGRQVMDQIEGFRMYLRTAEGDRLSQQPAPAKTPELFEKLLPYAIALGVENAWAEQFAGVLQAAAHGDGGYHPLWYQGASWDQVGSTGFASAIGSSLAGAISSSATAPGSSSGSGGGGSSGGGGGGGGGGGW